MKKIFFLFCLIFAFPALAQKLPQEYYSNINKADSLFKLKDYKYSAYAYSSAFKSNGGKGTLNDRYNAARAWAEAGIPDSAFFQLFRITDKLYFRDHYRVTSDEHLKVLQKDKRWENLIADMKKNASVDFGFERVVGGQPLANGWFQWGTKNYILRVDSTIKHSGKYSVLIEPLEDIDKKSFGCVAHQIINKYEGKEIELKAWIKMENVDDAIGLMIRLDGKESNKTLGFDNMMQKGIKGTKDWTQYSVKIPFQKEAIKIFVGVINSGSGKVWTDDFELFIDGKPINE